MVKSTKNTLILIFFLFGFNCFSQNDSLLKQQESFSFIGFMGGAIFPNQTTSLQQQFEKSSQLQKPVE